MRDLTLLLAVADTGGGGQGGAIPPNVGQNEDYLFEKIEINNAF